MTASFLARLSWPGLARVTKLLVAVLVMAACALFAVMAVRHLAFLTNANQYLVDLEVASLAPPMPQDPDIVIVAITEDTLAQFPYRAPVDRQFLAELLTALGEKGPRAIGIDLLFDQPTEPAKDEALRRAIATLKVPLRIAYAENGSAYGQSGNLIGDVQQAQKAYLRNFVPGDKRALVNLASDQFDVVRWIYPGAVTQGGRYVMGFSRALAEAAGVRTTAERAPIAWRGRPQNGDPVFKEYPAQTVKLLPAAWFKDKIVLIGSDITLVDRHRTPFMTLSENGEGLPGVVIQAYALAQLLHGHANPALSERGEFAIAFALAILGAVFGLSALPLWLRLGGGLLLIGGFWTGGAALFHDGGPLVGLVAPSLSFALAFFGMEAASGTEARAQRKFIESVFSYHVAPEVVEQIINNPTRMTSLEGERREMTFLFTDVADFTTLSEIVETKELARVLNDYLEVMTGIVQKHGGMVDKFIGDAVVAIFNAPIDLADHAGAAVRCALEMDRFATRYAAEQKERGIPFGLTRIGIHTGTAMVGNFGSRTRHNYTASGDAVNTAARLEGLNKYLGTHISVSGAAKEQCRGVTLRPVASVVLKGKTTAIDVWEPLQEDEARSLFITQYLLAYQALKNGSREALSLFEDMGREHARDACVAFHLKRLRQGETGVTVVMTEK